MLNHLTIESLSNHFKNNFELANYAIQVAQNLIHAGREVSPRILLDEITRNPEKYNLEKLTKEAEKHKERNEEGE